MRHTLLGFVLVAATCGLFPSTADAYWLYWLDDLSGPRFKAVLAEDIRLVCLKKNPDSKEIAEAGKRVGTLGAGGILSLCGLKNGERRHASLNLNLSWLSGEAPNLEDHKLVIIEPAFSVRATAALEFASGAGVAIFSGNFREGSRLKFILEPIRVDFRPLYLLPLSQRDGPTTTDKTKRKGSWFAEALVIRGGIMGFPSGFDEGFFGPDFKATNGPEFKSHIGTYIDTEPLLRRVFSRWY